MLIVQGSYVLIEGVGAAFRAQSAKHRVKPFLCFVLYFWTSMVAQWIDRTVSLVRTG